MRTILLITLLGYLMVGCQDPSTSERNQSNSDTTSINTDDQKATQREKVKAQPGEEIKTSYDRDYTGKRGSALSILNHRISADAENYSIIENGVWEYEFIHDGSGMSKQGAHDGEWLDFKDDHTYTKGKGKEVLSKGKYHYEFSNDLVLMIPDDNSANPEEWKTIFGTDIVMILVGTAEYGNNNYQMKLKRRKSLDEVSSN